MSDFALDYLSKMPAAREGTGVGRAAKLTLAVALLGFTVAVAARLLASALPSEVPAPLPAGPLPVTWLDITKPVQIYSLQAPALAGLPLVYAARRQSRGGGREDIMSFGAIGDGPALRLRVLRRGSEPVPKAPLYAAIARQAAEAGMAVERAGLPSVVPTRFGRFEVAAVALSDPASALAGEACSGFRLYLEAPALTVSGLACGKTLPRESLGCLVDRLDVASGGEDRELVDFFAATELRRDAGCSGMRLGPDGLHAAWLDDKPASPALSARPGHRR